MRKPVRGFFLALGEAALLVVGLQVFSGKMRAGGAAVRRAIVRRGRNYTRR